MKLIERLKNRIWPSMADLKAAREAVACPNQ